MTKLYSISWLSKSPTMRPVTSYKFWLLNQRLGLPQLQSCLFLQIASQYLIPTVFDHTECDLYPRPWSYGKPEKKSHAVKGGKAFLRHDFFQQVLSACPHWTLALENSLTRKGSGPRPGWLWSHSQDLRLPDLSLEKSHVCGKRMIEGEDFGRRCVKCTHNSAETPNY